MLTKTDGLVFTKILPMPMANSTARMLRDYEERRASLLSDGYVLRHETLFADGALCRLHHMANGNDIVLIARGLMLLQKTNHVVTHRHDYGCGCALHQP